VAEEGHQIAARRIDHVGVLVVDAEAARATFAEGFGLQPSEDWTEPKGSFRLVYLDSGDTTLQLVQPIGPGPLMDELAERGEGLHHLCFQIEGFDRTLDSLASGTNGEPYVGGRGSRVCFLTQRKHGVLVELTEPAT
jgi:methylmalonyl-CoA/ethylmalonyl-CoA epimerase